MTQHRPRRFALTAMAALMGIAPIGQGQPPRHAESTYKSPYAVQFTHPLPELIGDLENGARGNPQDEAAVPHSQWYSAQIERKFGAWGPPARHYPALSQAEQKPLSWKRERLMATALRFQGYGYQHHHVPDWSPPASWPWKHTAVGHNGKGVDCSNFTAFVYNLAFGIKPSGNVKNQSEDLHIPGPGPGRTTRAELVHKPGTYSELVKSLQTGDLLYVRNKQGEISHVVLWVGALGQAPDDLPLIVDSHGDDVRDSNGVAIPCGIHLRPFREKSWYYHSASHAHRILR